MSRLWQTLILSHWKPIFIHLPIEFMLMMILSALNDGVKLDTQDRLILQLLTKHPHITQNELVSKIGKSKSTIERRMRRLKQQGILIRVGGDKTGYWQVNKL